MTNIRLAAGEYQDVETRNMIDARRARGVPEEEILRSAYAMGRDNARTPMQWSAEENAGFTSGTPWLPVNPNHAQINAAAQVDDPSSVFAHYQGLIALRHESDLVVHGHFRLLEPWSEELFVYERWLGDERMLVVCNFTDHDVAYAVPAEYADAARVEAASNYDEPGAPGVVRPYEAFALLR